ncbi:TnsA endonuclease-like protein [Vogesella indigofera]|uniref:TnsA endonuclease-like protein n=1 Tax=Vogesella indigofera TaxID=45465 RepID=A0A495B0A8_VOGIN|nr:TnsA endonuclease N-terminal domain-containing protein [Vogesella indigofera]RKQ52895.1 TnsA endonuclease-like protein [Vogesella indigofera]
MSSILQAKPGHIAATPGQQFHTRDREVLRHTYTNMCAAFCSLKNGRMVHSEGLLEFDAFHWLEASPDVVEYREQCQQIYYPNGSRMRRYTPDIVATLTSGVSVCIEVKPFAKTLETDTKHRLACLNEYYRRHHQPFVVLTDKFIRQQPCLAQLRWLFQNASYVQPGKQEARMALGKLARYLPCSIATANIHLTGQRINAEYLMLAGYLHALDASEPLSYETLIAYGTSEMQSRLGQLDISQTLFWTEQEGREDA